MIRERLAPLAPIVGIVLGPALVAAALRLPLVNQLDYADAWFYSAYAWVPKHHFSVIGWNYFAVRFPAILSIGTFERAFGTDAGYVVLRLLLAVGSGTAVYLGVRRFASGGVALATVVLLYLDPFFSRMLLWDYASFVGVAAAMVGFGLWWWSDERHLAWTLLAGAALAMAVYANALLLTAVFVLFLVELGTALRSGRRRLRRVIARFVLSAIAAALVLVLGYLGYIAIIGSFGPGEMFRPTINFLRSNTENSAPYRHPPGEWLRHEVRIWPPVLVSLALVIALGRRVFGVDLVARVAQACIGYTAFLWLYRFTVTSSVIETWWAYSALVIVLAPAFGVLMHVLAERWRRPRIAIALPLVAVACTAVLIRDVPAPFAHLYRAVGRHPPLLFLLLGIGIAAAALVALRHLYASAAALTALMATVTLMMWAPSIYDGRGTTGVFVTDGHREWEGYRAARSFIDLVRDYDGRQSHVYTWYPGTTGLVNIGWTTLPQFGTTVQQLGTSEPLDHLLPLGMARLRQPDAAFVLIMSPRAADLPAARRALAGAGFGARAVRVGSWADGHLRYVLLRLAAKPG